MTKWSESPLQSLCLGCPLGSHVAELGLHRLSCHKNQGHTPCGLCHVMVADRMVEDQLWDAMCRDKYNPSYIHLSSTKAQSCHQYAELNSAQLCPSSPITLCPWHSEFSVLLICSPLWKTWHRAQIEQIVLKNQYHYPEIQLRHYFRDIFSDMFVISFYCYYFYFNTFL